VAGSDAKPFGPSPWQAFDMTFRVFQSTEQTFFTDGDELTIWDSGLIEAKSDDGERTLFSPSGYNRVEISTGHTRINYPG
jgi:hypothetical protein